MRRRPGIAGIQRDAATREQFKSAGEEVRRSALAQMKEQLALFQAKLQAFAREHKADIRRDPLFRAQFQAMCANIGVDPLASNKGMWNELLGFGDFYYELGVQLIEACLASRPLNGGIMELRVLRDAVTRRRGALGEPVSEDDVLRAIRKLQVLGGGLDVASIGARTFVRSVPGELNVDKSRVLELAHDKGHITKAELAAAAQWAPSRAEAVLGQLVRDKLALIDDGDTRLAQRLYWFPALLLLGQHG